MLIEQIATRPTAEINGIIGGYTGEGAKTVIPGKAMAKVSFRLVGEQNPEKIRKAFRAFVKARLPADCKVEFGNFAGAPAIELPFDSPALAKTRAALSGRMGQEGDHDRRGRLDPDRRRLQARARHGHDHGRLRARRRPRAFAEREVRSHQLPQGHAQLGADPGGAGGVAAQGNGNGACERRSRPAVRCGTGAGFRNSRSAVALSFARSAKEEPMVQGTAISPHMEVVGSDGIHVGVVDHMEGADQVKLTKSDTVAGGQHHFIPLAWVDRVDQKVHLKQAAAEAKARWKSN